MKNLIHKTVVASAVAASLVASSGAMAQTNFPDFTVSEGAITGANPASVSADKITGNYVEVITFTGTSFDVSLKWNAGQFVTDNGTRPVPSQLGGVTANQYGLYGLYTGRGTLSTSGATTTFTFSPGGSLQLFADPGGNTTFNQPGTGAAPWTTGSSGDDILLANGVPISGDGRLDRNLPTCGTGGINCGDFGASSSFNVTTQGNAYFTSPRPFYTTSFQSGQLNNFATAGTQVINGSLDLILGLEFPVPPAQVPEPATLAVLGLGLMGLGLARRRKQG